MDFALYIVHRERERNKWGVGQYVIQEASRYLDLGLGLGGRLQVLVRGKELSATERNKTQILHSNKISNTDQVVCFTDVEASLH